MSSASTVSVGSGDKSSGHGHQQNKSRKSLSRGEMLRNMSGMNRWTLTSDWLVVLNALF